MKSSRRSFQKWGGSMGKSFLLARSNLRKAKGQMAAIVMLIFLAALMLNLWLVLSLDYKQNFDRYHKKLNAEHVTLVVDDDSMETREFLVQTLEDDKRTAEYHLDDVMHMFGLFEYHDGEMNSEFVFLEKQAAVSREIGRIEIVEEGSCESGIYMPMIYKSENIAVGNTMKLTIGSNEVSYQICGFFNSVMRGSHNCSMCEIILTEDKYRELQEMGYAPKAVLCSVRLDDKHESQDYEAMLKNEVSSQYPSVRKISNSYALVAQSRYISQMICSGVMSAMAFFILLIALVVIASNIGNYIGENMQNLGALKAMGYTSGQLIDALMLQFLGFSLLSVLAGVGISYLVFPFVNVMMVSQTGIPYQNHFLPVPFLITLVVLGGAVAVVVWSTSRRIKKIEPIVALRQGVTTHNFKRNHIPLEQTKAPLNLALALKTTLGGVKQNVTVCVTMLVLSLVLVFSGVMVENVIVDETPFLNLIVGETADSCIDVNAGIEDEFLRAMEEDGQVEKAYLYHIITVSHVGGLELIAAICDDFSNLTNQTIVFEGRFPEFDNEIAVAAKYAREQKMKIGDEITVTADGKEAEYIITGFTQISNNLGKDCLLTRAGYERMGELQHTSYYLKLAEEASVEEFNSKVEERFGQEVNTTIDIKSTLEAACSVYISLMTIIVAAILVISAVVIVFVLYLLVRTMINNKKQEYGILKALGFTTGQLILQTALSFMPAVIVSTVIGLVINTIIINPLTAVFLSGIGIVKCTFPVPAGFIAVAGIGLVAFAFAASCLLSLKIKKIAPRSLMAGE